ncbi:MAG: hypothetical protein HYX34_09870 [Actinobacteria bacterium]|nr:hypothetical protein [Actinomycetota bacterium]
MAVSPEDRARWERQVAGLRTMETDDEGTPEWQAAMVRAENARPARVGAPALKEWWEEPPEAQLHQRAKALGMLDRPRPQNG